VAYASTVSQSIAKTAGAVTPHATNPNNWHYLYVGTGGTLNLVSENGDSFSLANVPNGSWVWVRTSKVLATSTASDIVGFRG
jgi:hypothetical protein